MEYPKGTKFGTYIVVNDGTKTKPVFGVRQQVTLPDGKRVQPRVNKKRYSSCKTRKEFDQFVDRLNHQEDKKKIRAIQIRTAFIPPELIEGFRSQLGTEIPNQKDANYMFNKVLKSYFLDFFISKLKIQNPKEWIKKQSEWGEALLSISETKIFPAPVSAKTIKATVQIANRFMKYLHLQMPTEYPSVVFEPLSKARLKSYDADRDKEEIGKYIPEADWIIIEKKLPPEIGCFIRLMYYYGLRRAESLGFDSSKAVRKDYLKVSKQLKKFNDDGPIFGILKDKEQRNTPHWVVDPSVTYKLVEESIDKKMHPDTLSLKWDQFIKILKMDYRLHDFRRTFITNVLRSQNARDVQLAVGHANLATTMSYAQDDRALGDEEFKPETA